MSSTQSAAAGSNVRRGVTELGLFTFACLSAWTVLLQKCDTPSLLKGDQIARDNRLPAHCRRLCPPNVVTLVCLPCLNLPEVQDRVESTRKEACIMDAIAATTLQWANGAERGGGLFCQFNMAHDLSPQLIWQGPMLWPTPKRSCTQSTDWRDASVQTC